MQEHGVLQFCLLKPLIRMHKGLEAQAETRGSKWVEVFVDYSAVRSPVVQPVDVRAK